MIVTQFEEGGVIRIKPPMQEDWTPLRKLQWLAATVALKCDGSHAQVTQSGDGDFSVQLNGSYTSPLTWIKAWSYLNGVESGWRACQRHEDGTGFECVP